MTSDVRNGSTVAGFVDDNMPFGNLINWAVGNKNGYQYAGNIAADLGAFSQLFSKHGYKVKNAGHLVEILGDGFQRHDINDLGGVGADAVANYFGQKLFGDGFLGRMAAAAAGWAARSFVENALARFDEIDPEAAADSPEVQAAKEGALKDTQAQMAAMGIGAGGLATGAALSQEELVNSGLTGDVLTPQQSAVLTQSGLTMDADKAHKQEYIQQRLETLPKGENGEFFTVDQRRQTAAREYDAAWGANPQRLMTEAEYVSNNRTQDLQVSTSRHSLDSFQPVVYNREDYAAEGEFLTSEYQTQLAIANENIKRAQEGCAPLTPEEIAQNFAPKTPEFNQAFDVKGVGNGTPLQGASLDIYKENGMVVPVDMDKYRNEYVTARMETLQGRPGIDEYKTVAERRAAALREFNERYPEGTQLERLATKEEFVALHSEQRVQTHYNGPYAPARISNTENVKDERAYLEQRYNELMGTTRGQIDNALECPDEYRMQRQGERNRIYANQQTEQVKAGATAGLAGVNVNDYADLGTPNMVEIRGNDTQPSVDPRIASLIGYGEMANTVKVEKSETLEGGTKDIVSPLVANFAQEVVAAGPNI